MSVVMIFFFKQKTAYEMRISDWSSDVCSSDLKQGGCGGQNPAAAGFAPAFNGFLLRASSFHFHKSDLTIELASSIYSDGSAASCRVVWCGCGDKPQSQAIIPRGVIK